MKHFQLYELVSKEVYDSMGDKAWDLFKPNALIMLDNFREFIGAPCSVNNWYGSDGSYEVRQLSGFRPQSCPIGAKFSQHKLGNAFDVHVSGMTAGEARKRILADQNNSLLLNIMRLEDKVAWVHMDAMVLPVGVKRIHVFQQ
jgi:hypothetical protein